MIPAPNHPGWTPLVKGDIKPTFKVFAGNMMLSQAARKLRMDTSPQALKDSIQEAHAFFTKYQGLYQEELKAYF